VKGIRFIGLIPVAKKDDTLQYENTAKYILFRQLNTLKVVMPDLTRALQGIRHPVSPMDVAYASEDTGSRALEGILRNDGNSIVLLPV
jgi:hypothetical protein